MHHPVTTQGHIQSLQRRKVRNTLRLIEIRQATLESMMVNVDNGDSAVAQFRHEQAPALWIERQVIDAAFAIGQWNLRLNLLGRPRAAVVSTPSAAKIAARMAESRIEGP